ncbi:MAG: hypothetical protein E7596_05870 [Ruminococcaceae bacterium]|nr:hypothetical protein [Oscillospiraceae bacterium]
MCEYTSRRNDQESWECPCPYRDRCERARSWENTDCHRRDRNNSCGDSRTNGCGGGRRNRTNGCGICNLFRGCFNR